MASHPPKSSRRRTPKLLKDFLQSPGFRAFLYATAAAYVHLIRATTRWTIVREDIPQRLWDAGQPFILAFWHGRNLVMPMCWRTSQQINMLASQHRDGDITENVLKRLGLKALRGSSANRDKGKTAKGGAAALRAMARVIQAGESVGITPDGPRGPRMRASDGIGALARLTGVPVVASAVATSNRRLLKTWDRMLVPLPFSRGTIVWGEPIYVARGGGAAALDEARLAIEAELNRVTHEADRLLGRKSPEPAPLQPAPDLAAASP
jgi:hypothetical protein